MCNTLNCVRCAPMWMTRTANMSLEKNWVDSNEIIIEYLKRGEDIKFGHLRIRQRWWFTQSIPKDCAPMATHQSQVSVLLAFFALAEREMSSGQTCKSMIAAVLLLFCCDHWKCSCRDNASFHFCRPNVRNIKCHHDTSHIHRDSWTKQTKQLLPRVSLDLEFIFVVVVVSHAQISGCVTDLHWIFSNHIFMDL